MAAVCYSIFCLIGWGREGGTMVALDTASLLGKEPLSLPQAKANKPMRPGENRINLQAKGRH